MLEKHGKALLVYGPGHLFRTQGDIDFLSAIGGGITKTLEADYPGRTFVVFTLGGPYPKYQEFERALKTSTRPVLVSLERSPFRDFTAEEFIGLKMRKYVNGRWDGFRSVNGGWVSLFRGSGLTLGQLADACVYSGIAADADTRVRPNR